MKKKAQSPQCVDAFAQARDAFKEIVAWAGSARCPDHHADLEEQLEVRGREVLRLAMQGRLDKLYSQESERLRRRPIHGRVRERKRLLEGRFGQFPAQGLLIATGVIEGACRHLIQDRLGMTGEPHPPAPPEQSPKRPASPVVPGFELGRPSIFNGEGRPLCSNAHSNSCLARLGALLLRT